ncbi:MAG: TonB-dependent receptor [Pseudomonadota bacterium]
MTIHAHKTVFTGVSILAVVALMPGIAQAQTALEEIFVTAQKRAQSLQDVPISVAVTTGQQLRDNSVQKLEDFTISMPNLFVAESALGDLLFIRGVGSGQNSGFEQSVGTFIDGIYYGRGLQTRNSFLDVERVEILRGPQSTFFGNNTVAGAINITTNLPSQDDLGGYVQSAYETGTGKANVEAAIGGPLTDTFAMRFTGLYSDQKGWQTNRTINEREPQEEKIAGRLTALWTPTETLTAILRVQREETETQGRALQAVGCPPPDGQAPAGYCLAFGVIGNGTPADFLFDEFRNGGNGVTPFPTDAEFNDLDNTAASLTINWDVSGHQLTSVTGYTDYSNRRSQGGILLAGPFPAPAIPFANFENVDESFEQFSQELRLTSPAGRTIEYMAGLYYQSSDLQVINDFSAAPFATRLSDHRQDEETLSAFGALTWNATDALRLSVGLRYTQVDKDVSRDQILASNQGNLVLEDAVPITPDNPLFGAFVFGFGWGNTGETPLTASRSDDDLLISVNAQYSINSDIMAYASYSEGFKAGGFDEQNGRLDPASFSFEPEQATSYEIGLKSTLLDGAMRFNISAFFTDFSNLQQQTFDGVINFLVTNAASARSKGVETDLVWQLSDAFRLDLQVAYLDANNKVRTNAQCTTTQAAGLAPGCINGQQDLSGAPLIFSPSFSGSFGITHDYDINDSLTLITNAGGFFEDSFFQTDDNDPFLIQEAYAKFNASVRLVSAKGWELAIIGRNIFDVQTSHSGDDLPLSAGSYLQFLDKPRTVAFQGRFTF